MDVSIHRVQSVEIKVTHFTTSMEFWNVDITVHSEDCRSANISLSTYRYDHLEEILKTFKAIGHINKV